MVKTVVVIGGVVSAFRIRNRGPRFDSRVAQIYYWVATLGKLFTHILSSKKLGVQKGVVMMIKCARLSEALS